MKDITIKPALNGWKIKVGCQEVLFTNRKTMFKEISRYINDPDKVEREYLKNAKNKLPNGLHVDEHGNQVILGGSINFHESPGENWTFGNARDNL